MNELDNTRGVAIILAITTARALLRCHNVLDGYAQTQRKMVERLEQTL
jgi:cobalamin biosynthesis protein CobT